MMRWLERTYEEWPDTFETQMCAQAYVYLSLSIGEMLRTRPGQEGNMHHSRYADEADLSLRSPYSPDLRYL